MIKWILPSWRWLRRVRCYCIVWRCICAQISKQQPLIRFDFNFAGLNAKDGSHGLPFALSISCNCRCSSATITFIYSYPAHVRFFIHCSMLETCQVASKMHVNCVLFLDFRLRSTLCIEKRSNIDKVHVHFLRLGA